MSAKLKLKDKTSLYRRLAVLLESGVSLNQSLRILLESDTNKEILPILRKTQKLLQSGLTAADSMKKTGFLTDQMHLQIVLIGEQTGRLAYSFGIIANSVDEQDVFRSQMKQALSYPVIVLSVAFLSLIILILFVVPSFAEVFRSMNTELPFITVFILGINDAVRGYWVYAVVTAAIIYLLLKNMAGKNSILRFYDKIQYELPFIGSINRLKLNYEFCMNLSVLVSSGIPLLTGLKLLSKHNTSFVFSKQLEYFSRGLENGERFSSLLSQSPLISPIVQQMITVGEETAEMPKLLQKASQLFKQELDAKVSTISTVIEPLLIIFLGIIVGIILIAMYLPLFESMNSISG